MDDRGPRLVATLDPTRLIAAERNPVTGQLADGARDRKHQSQSGERVSVGAQTRPSWVTRPVLAGVGALLLLVGGGTALALSRSQGTGQLVGIGPTTPVTRAPSGGQLVGIGPTTPVTSAPSGGQLVGTWKVTVTLRSVSGPSFFRTFTVGTGLIFNAPLSTLRKPGESLSAEGICDPSGCAFPGLNEGPLGLAVAGLTFTPSAFTAAPRPYTSTCSGNNADIRQGWTTSLKQDSPDQFSGPLILSAVNETKTCRKSPGALLKLPGMVLDRVITREP